MINPDKLCMGCMRPKEYGKECSYCGYTEENFVPGQFLSPNSNLLDRYLVGKVLSTNGEGTTYIGWDHILESPITIREFYPDTLAVREGNKPEVNIISGCEATFNEYKIKFLEYWRSIARMRDLSAIVPVYDIFEENNTAYTISEYHQGITLEKYLAQKNGTLTWEAARVLFMPVLSGLSSLHSAGIMHYGICPENLIIGQDGKMKLVGFSIAETRTAMTDLKPQLYPGYSAIEQYGYEALLSPATDIYGFAATLYRTLTGITLPVATARKRSEILKIPVRFYETLPIYVINALANALAVNPDDRTKSFERLRAEISDAPTISPSLSSTVEIDTVEHDVKGKKSKPKKKHYGIIALVSSLLMLLVFCATIILILFGDRIFPDNTNSNILSSSSSLQSKETSAVLSESVSSEPLVTYVTPNLVGQRFEQVINSTLYSYITIEKESEAFSDEYAEGVIMAQDIQPDTLITKDTVVKVKVSLGSQKRVVPNVVGMTYMEATTNLQHAGLRIRFEGYVYNDNYPNDVVYSTEPEAGTTVDYQTEVKVYINKK